MRHELDASFAAVDVQRRVTIHNSAYYGPASAVRCIDLRAGQFSFIRGMLVVVLVTTTDPWIDTHSASRVAAVSDRIVPNSPVTGQPILLHWSTSPCELAELVAIAARLSLGCEGPSRFLPNPPPRRRNGPDASEPGHLPLSGLTVAEAFTRIVEAAPIYQWHEEGDVVIMRPLPSSRDRSGFLNQQVSPASLGLSSGVVEVFYLFLRLSGRNADFRRSPYAAPPLQVHFKGGTALQLLNATAGAQQGIMWYVSYTDPEDPTLALPSGSVFVSLIPVDGGGIGGVIPGPSH